MPASLAHGACGVTGEQGSDITDNGIAALLHFVVTHVHLRYYERDWRYWNNDKERVRSMGSE